MDERLISWAIAVKSRNRGRLPPIWLLTDAQRLPDPRAVVAALPKGLCGVVLRHDDAPDRAELGRDLVRLCRARRNLLVVAGDWKLAHQLRAGVHLRGGRALPFPRGPITSSAHGRAEIARAQRAGAAAIFLSPLFATKSHPSARPLGTVKWSALTLHFSGECLALGGVNGATLRGLVLPRCAGLGAIGYLSR